MKIKLYRHTIRHEEPLSDGTSIVTYSQNNWGSVKVLFPGRDRKVVKIEEKEIEVEDENSPRARKCQELLDDIEWNLEYFMGSSREFKDMKTTHFQYLRDYINEVSKEKKLTEIQLASKIKSGDKDGSVN